MRHTTIYTLLLTLCATLIIGCEKEPAGQVQGPISFSDTTIEASDNGGEYAISYELQDALEGFDLVVTSDEPWIRDIDVDGEEITLRVLGNPLYTSREATLTVKYPTWSQDESITVRQEGVKSEKLTLTLTDSDYSTCEVNIAPHDDQMYYIVMVAEKAYFVEKGISTAEELVRHDIDYFVANMSDAPSLDAFLVDSYIALQGTNKRMWENLSPAKEYIIYAYGVELGDMDYMQVTPVYHIALPKRLPELQSVEFDINITSDGPEVEFDIEPIAWDGYYMVQVIRDDQTGYIAQGDPRDEAFEEAVATSFFYVSDNLYYYYEYSAERILEEMGHKGHSTYSQTLDANHRYMAIVYAIASEREGSVPVMVSKPIVEYFATGDVVMSDMTFDITISNIRPRAAEITITPSTNDEAYTAVVLYARNMPDGTNGEQLRYIHEHYSPFEVRGSYSETVSSLKPDTEFIVAVYGIYAGAPTTDLYYKTFKTTKEGAGSNLITAIEWKAYDLEEVLTLDSYYESMYGFGDYFLSVDIHTLQPTERVYFDIFRTSHIEENGEKWVKESLMDYSYHTLFDWGLCSYNNEYVVCGYAEDADGNIGELFTSAPIVVQRGETGDAAEFIERYAEYTE